MTLGTLRTLPTNHGLLTEARHLVLPEGITSSGFPAVHATCLQIGLGFDPWQVDLNRCILAKNSSGLYAADTVVISISRQVGKTYDIGALIFADCIINPGTTVVWTAHRFKVSRETFNSLRAIAKSPLLAAHIDYESITTAAGNECIPFRNGSRIVFAARERGAIRGVAKVRRLILDEAQILSEAAMADLIPTMNQAENPQIILMGTPPKPNDPGEVFTNLRREALAGTSEEVLYVEFAAPPDSDPNDRAAWRVANPSYPLRTPAKAILRMKKLLTPEDFRREALGIWDDDGGNRIISAAAWEACKHPAEPVTGPIVLAVETTLDRSSSSIVAVATTDDGPRVKVLKSAPGTGWVAAEIVTIASEHPEVEAVVVDDKGQAGTLADAIEDALDAAALSVEVVMTNTSHLAEACGLTLEHINTGSLRHGSDPELDAAVRGAEQRPLGDNAWAWSRRKGGPTIAPLVAMSLALWKWLDLTNADYDPADSFG